MNREPGKGIEVTACARILESSITCFENEIGVKQVTDGVRESGFRFPSSALHDSPSGTQVAIISTVIVVGDIHQESLCSIRKLFV